ncbi:MAG: hypothetical protein IKR04_04090 [Clostridia bacterium]|nr:hypothetical protein [Clostridia bacterium]
MLLYDYFHLKEADFVNVELKNDNKIFVDPFLISIEESSFSKMAANSIRDYFKALLKSARDGNKRMSKALLENLHERNETRTGYSVAKPKGIGFAGDAGEDLFNNIIKSKAMKTNMISDIFDCSIMVDRVGADKISDLIINIIFLQLIEYTQKQCRKNRIPLSPVVLRYKIWNYKTFSWEKVVVELPLDEDDNPIVFLPKEIASDKMFYDYQRVYNTLMIPFYEQVEIQDASSGLVKILKSGKRKVLKKDLRAKYPCTKAEVVKFVQENNQVYARYKKNQFTYVTSKNLRTNK